MKNFDWDKTIDAVQFGMLWFVIILLVICVAVLILFDVLAGAGIMNYMTNGNTPAAVFISMATSGLLISLMLISSTLGKSESTVQVSWFVGLIAFLVYCVDVYFDGLSADWLRYGFPVVLKTVDNPNLHLLFRSLIGGISTVGEALAMTVILGMPVLKGMVNMAIPESYRKIHSSTQSQPRQESSQKANPQVEQFRQQHQKPVQRPTPPEPGNTVELTYHPMGILPSEKRDIPEFLQKRSGGEKRRQ